MFLQEHLSIPQFSCSGSLVFTTRKKLLIAMLLRGWGLFVIAEMSPMEKGSARSCGFPVLGMEAAILSWVAAERRKNAAHGASRGWAKNKPKPRRGERNAAWQPRLSMELTQLNPRCISGHTPHGSSSRTRRTPPEKIFSCDALPAPRYISLLHHGRFTHAEHAVTPLPRKSG